MVDLILVRDERHLSLVPATDMDAERIKKLRKRRPMQARLVFTRSDRLHRWYWGLVQRVAEGNDMRAEALHVEIKVKAGFVEHIIMSQAMGGVAFKLRSTSFPEMDDSDFAKYVEFAVEILCRDYLGHIGSRARQKQILEWVGHRPKLRM